MQIVEQPSPNVASLPLPGAYASLKPAVSLTTGKGKFFLFLPEKHVVVSQFFGHIDRQAADALRDFGNRQFEQTAKVYFFHDWEQVKGYDSEARTSLTNWAIERRAHIPCVVVLTQSKLVAMGVATANLATHAFGLTMRSHTSRSAFEKELQARLEERAK